MHDPLRRPRPSADRVRAADQQVAGVQAQRDPRAGQQPVHVRAGLDHGADVRVQAGRARRGRRRARPAGRALRTGSAHPAASSSGRPVVAVEPVAAASTSTSAPAATKPASASSTSGAGSWARSCSTTGTKPPTAGQPVTGELLRPAPRVRGQEAVGAELGRRQADRRASPRAPARRSAGGPSPAPRTRPRRSARRPSAVRSSPHLLHPYPHTHLFHPHRAALAPRLFAGLCDKDRLQRLRHRAGRGARLGHPEQPVDEVFEFEDVRLAEAVQEAAVDRARGPGRRRLGLQRPQRRPRVVAGRDARLACRAPRSARRTLRRCIGWPRPSRARRRPAAARRRRCRRRRTR